VGAEVCVDGPSTRCSAACLVGPALHMTCHATCHLGPALQVILSSTCEVRYVAGAVAGVGRASGHSDGADAERGDGGSETTQPSRVLPASLLEDVHLGCLPHTMSTTQRQYQARSTAIPVCCA